MDPVTLGLLGSSALSAGGSIFGGMMGSTGQAQTNAQQIQANQQMQQFANNFTAQQGDIARDFNMTAMRDTMDFNANQAHQAQSFNAGEAMKARDWAGEQAGIQRNYQTEMANTAWQRGIADMKKAGINPILAASLGGASTPQGSMPTGAAASGSGASSSGASSSSGSGASGSAGHLGNPGESVARGISSAAQVGRQLLDLKATSQQIDESKARTTQSETQSDLNKSAKGYQDSNTLLNNVLQDKARQDTATSASQAKAADAAAASHYADAGYNAARTITEAHNATSASQISRIRRAEADNAELFGPGTIGNASASLTRGLATGFRGTGKYIEGVINNTYDLWKNRNTIAPAVTNPGNSDFWGTSQRIRDRAAQNRKLYGGP